MVFSELREILSLFDRFMDWARSRSAEKRSIAARFIKVFDAHGIHRNQIPRFFGHGLEVVDVSDNNRLLERLNGPLLEGVCATFAIRREWLEGVDDDIYETRDFYKRPEEFSSFIDELISSGHGALTAFLLVAEERTREPDCLLILEQYVGDLGRQPIFRYFICNNWIYRYWKARCYLAACVATAFSRQVNVVGRVA